MWYPSQHPWPSLPRSVLETTEALASATDMFEQAHSQNRSSPVSLDYASSLIGSASAIWTACELQPPAATDVRQLNMQPSLSSNGQTYPRTECRNIGRMLQSRFSLRLVL